MSDTRPLADRLQDDQSLRSRADERPLVESYLAANPELWGDDAGLLDLVNHEVLLREERGEAPGLAEYLGRFPHLAAPLRDLFDVHAQLEAEAADPPTPAETPQLHEFATRSLAPGDGAEQVEFFQDRAEAPPNWRDGLPAILPAHFGRYTLHKLLGKGGMGAVYLAA